jgi:alginate O-acetyltransferase complex protein AlgI
MLAGNLPLSTQITIYAVALVLAWFLSARLRSVRQRQVLLLAVSYILYATWGVWFLAVLVSSSLMNYGLGIYLRKNPSARRLWLGVVLNVALLSIFKYLPLAARAPGVSLLGGLGRLVLPIGMSFWTFEALSYLLDLYREEDLDPTLLEFCLYMAFWPTALSGPICRLPQLLPQLRKYWTPLWDDLAVGAQRMGVGLLMMWLSQILAAGLYPNTGVDSAFSVPVHSLRGVDVWFMIVGYGFQLFFNFCGYSHLVIGAARLFGFRLAENFNRPYLSTSPSEFWTRWHMSLSFWIRDYVFFPLATRRPELWWRNLSLVIAMFVFGLWHKGSILFMAWGIYHGLLLSGHRYWQQSRVGLRAPGFLMKPVSWLVTFAGVSVGWIFFRAESIHNAAGMLRAAFSPGGFLQPRLPKTFYALVLVLAAGYFLVVGAGKLLDRWESTEAGFDRRSPFMNAGSVRFMAGARLLAQNRWVWLAPTLAVLTLYLYILLQPRVEAGPPMLYRLF